MSYNENKYVIKIPRNTQIIYCEKRQILVASNNKNIKFIKLNLKLFFSKDKKTIKVSQIPSPLSSTKNKTKIRSIRGFTVASIKLLLTEIENTFYKKLKLVGVGFKITDIENEKIKLLSFKLGFSHFIYTKIDFNLSFLCLKNTQLFIFGNSFKHISDQTATIRSFKKPEPYKGKGILYELEKIKLKEGKKV